MPLDSESVFMMNPGCVSSGLLLASQILAKNDRLFSPVL